MVFLAVVCLFLTVVGSPFALLVTESLVWLAAWLVRPPAVRRWLARVRRGRPG